MNEAINTIIELLKIYYSGNEILVYVSLVSLLYLLIFEKEVRNKLVLPLLFIAFVVLNPYLYLKVFSKTYAYWRMFWIFSLHLVMGIGFICIMKRLKYVALQTAMFIFACLLIVENGTYVFTTNLFEKTVSLEKLPYGVVEICEKMLEIEDEPVCVSDRRFSLFSRQYSAKIKQPWGRNATGFISSIGDSAKEYFELFHVHGEYNMVLEWAKEKKYHFLVIEEEKEIDPVILEKYSFVEIMNVGEFRLYHYIGIE